ncbi:SGNH/GDSL hydrolase family protein [Paenibacillus sp. Root444D2]|uniref:SGNH/GDSL hydrolase family protein n=1 Tax=Paenibacillus sp. Root444D2 TaxID=1736538 RepID=UPI0009E82275|nr:SGNH/GDSL hydrolase family protein [Paenibacillus sp. Root444D2]
MELVLTSERTFSGYGTALAEARCCLLPILLVSQIRLAKEAFDVHMFRQREERKQFQQEIVERLRQSGDDHIHFFNGEEMLGIAYGECTVDGIHPSDLGYKRMSEALKPLLENLLHPYLK